MKLNNKGFAFSTMLYGVLSLIIIVLMLVFSLLKSTKDETSYFSSEIEDNLNKCVFEEVALENCYTSGSGCDATSYYACLGISGSTTGSTGGFIVAEKLKENVVTTGDGLYQDSVDAKRYVYRGSNVNNYVKYSGLIWRVVSIEADGSLKVVFPGYANTLQWDNTNKEDWGSSSLNNYLNNTFYASLSDTSGLVRKIWHTGRIYNTGTMTLLEISEQENRDEYSGTTGTEGMVGVLSSSDFIKASLSTTCSDDVMNSTTCASWLSVYKSWLINSNGDIAAENTQQAYYFNNDNKLSTTTVDSELNVLPTVFLKRTLVITTGDGTESNPYIVG